MGFFDNKFKLQTSTPVTDFPANDDGMKAPASEAGTATQLLTAPSPDEGKEGATASAEPTQTAPVAAAPASTESNAPASTATSTTPIDTSGITSSAPSFTQQPTAEETKVTPNQGITIDWSRPFSEIEKNPILRQMNSYDILKDFAKNGNGDYAAFMPWLNSLGDMDKTVDANEALKKKEEKQAKWERWGNLFSHVGNFLGTIHGAPNQKIESMQDLTERQRKIKASTDALRQKGYDNIMLNIYKDRNAKAAEMQAQANAKEKAAMADYYASQKKQKDALTPELVKTEQAKQGASKAAAGLSAAKTDTENQLRDKKGKLLTAQAKNADTGAALHGAQIKATNAKTAKTVSDNAKDKEADDFNTNYVNDPTFKKYVNQWASHNGMAVGGSDGTGGTWNNKYNRQQASAWAKAKMAQDKKNHSKTPPSRRRNDNSKVPPSRRK